MYHERLAVVSSLYEYHENVVWIKTYPISYAATHFDSRMTIIRLSGGRISYSFTL
jgi:hypothetical protein